MRHTHQVRPGVRWCELPELNARLDADRYAGAGAGSYAGSTEIARRYLFRLSARVVPWAPTVARSVPSPGRAVGDLGGVILSS
jgi:hypothetical protein